MKIGIFDSGLGGLVIGNTIMKAMPDYDYIYLGDTLHVPYGKRSKEAIYDLTKAAVEWLFEQDCQLVIIACNTASATALRQLQQTYLPDSPYKNRRILGVVVPTLEETIDQGFTHIGLIATQFTIRSGIYEKELKKIKSEVHITAKETPLLVPLIENDGIKWAPEILAEYLQPLKKAKIESLILGCTHYPILKPFIHEILGDDFPLISQEKIMPGKMLDYLKRHPEHSTLLTKNGERRFCVTDLSPNYIKTAKVMIGDTISFEKIDLLS